MRYELRFLPAALKEWKKLNPPIQQQLKRKLASRLEAPAVAADKLSGFDAVYKIKLRAAGYRLVYEVSLNTKPALPIPDFGISYPDGMERLPNPQGLQAACQVAGVDSRSC